MSQYNEEDIFTPTGLDFVRMRPTAFFRSTGLEGLLHAADEIITNGIDEIALMPEHAGKLLVLLCIDSERNTYQIVVKDNGRGVPNKFRMVDDGRGGQIEENKFLDSFTRRDTSGKFNTKAYQTSGGLYGQGAKATAGTSLHFRPITHRPECSASFYVNQGKTDGVLEYLNVPPKETGTTVIFEPDPEIFTSDIAVFGEQGQVELCKNLQKYCYFHRLNVEFRVYPFGLPADIWTMPLMQAEQVIADRANSANVVFRESTFDAKAWLREYWNVTRPFSLQYTITDSVDATITGRNARDITMRYEVQFYTVKSETMGGRFGMVNNIPIDDHRSTHFVVAQDVLKMAVSGHIKENPVRKYFIDHYRIPVFIAADIKFPGAEFSGTTKDAFISREFRAIYEPSIQEQLSKPEGVGFITALYQELASDIETKYTQTMTGVAPVKNRNRLFEEFPGLRERFYDCTTSNRRSAELFMVEGRSAGGSQGRNHVDQGIYYLKGKPFNGVTAEDKVRQSIAELRKRETWQEIIAITGVNPSSFNRDSLHFGKAWVVLTDADNE